MLHSMTRMSHLDSGVSHQKGSWRWPIGRWTMGCEGWRLNNMTMQVD